MKALSIYLMCGPDTPALAEAAVAGGADLLELGFPFSDPLADGPVVRRAAERALAQGMRTAACLDCLAETRARVDVPLIPMTYASLLEAYGWERFAADARERGATSLIVADLPADERPELRRVQLFAPTSTDERIRLAAERTDGWLYLVTVAGTTGARDDLSPALAGLAKRARALTEVPLYAGFGISTPEQAAAAGDSATASSSALLRCWPPRRARTGSSSSSGRSGRRWTRSAQTLLQLLPDATDARRRRLAERRGSELAGLADDALALGLEPAASDEERRLGARGPRHRTCRSRIRAGRIGSAARGPDPLRELSARRSRSGSPASMFCASASSAPASSRSRSSLRSALVRASRERTTARRAASTSSSFPARSRRASASASSARRRFSSSSASAPEAASAPRASGRRARKSTACSARARSSETSPRSASTEAIASASVAS